MNKILTSSMCVVFFCMTTSAAAANKIGLAVDQGFGITGQFDNINAFIGNDGLSADYIFNQGSFREDIPVNWYVGAGGYYNWSGRDNIGARLPLGLTFPFAKRWDIYGQVAPVLDFDLDKNDLKFKLDFAVGIRYAF
ncbi:hypothetical protein GCM10007916_07580 [Psychromonas marina]|uniref:Outer membrane protein beta-barrel domain-containing protein n=1 Tax=Psychromonas marina TaxID=88364 RepID=A0ABQ6DX09_9GAMM|nr:hypothetical protein [Psychromonas marina]GLS89691.1 hypothetical protein GCM10007916_07580 [Psychromonas marina]